jgi:hypothetical protein
MGTGYEKYKTRYSHGGCTKEQLHRIVGLNPVVLSAAGYEDITGEVYMA